MSKNTCDQTWENKKEIDPDLHEQEYMYGVSKYIFNMHKRAVMVYVRGRAHDNNETWENENEKQTNRGWGLGIYIRIELVYIHVYNGACLNLWITYLKTISSILFNPK